MKTGVNTKYAPDTLEAAIAHLRASEGAHVEVVHQALVADNSAIYPADMVLQGVAQRSLMLISGFTLMVEQGNHVCAIPLLRLQLDNIMRFNALWLTPDTTSILAALLSDTPFKKLKSRDGQPMTDAYLAEQLSKRHPWVAEVYKKTSGFIHLSTPGLLSGVTQVGDDASRMVYMHIGTGVGRQWRDAEKKEAVDAFIAATDALLQLFVSWVVTKERVAEERRSRDDGATR